MSTRPLRTPRPAPKPENLYDFTVVFTDDSETITVTDVPESEMRAATEAIGDPEGFIHAETSPGVYYITATRRIKHITATLTETTNETSN